jgi:hypothetical protein
MNYRLPLPPIEQLAALAASVNTERTAQGKIDMAIDIWQLAHQRIEHNGNVTAQTARSAEKFDTIMEGREVQDGMPLASFLKNLVPSSKPEDTMKWYRDYLRDNVIFCRGQEGKPPLPESELQSAVVAMIERDRNEGVVSAYWNAIGFRKHRNAAAKKTQSERGKKGAEKKHLEQKKPTKNGASKAILAPSKTNPAPTIKNAATTNNKRAGSKQ